MDEKEENFEFSAISDKVLANIEAEKWVLGAVLFDSEAICKLENILPVKALFLNAHRIIYKRALDLFHSGKPTDLVTLQSYLEDKGELEIIGGIITLVSLLDNCISSANLEAYVSLIVDKYQRRLLRDAGYKITLLASDTTTELEKIVDLSEHSLYSVSFNKGDRFEPKLIKESLLEIFSNLDKQKPATIPTGITALDNLTGGLARQDLIIIGARPGVGKTWLAIHLSRAVALQDKVVVFFSAEMSHEQLTKRFIAMQAGLDAHRVSRDLIYESELDAYVNAMTVLADCKIIIDDSPAEQLSTAKMRSVLRRVEKEHGEIGLIVLDYLQKLGSRSAVNRAQVVGEYSGACKDMAKIFDCPFVALAQINRGVELRSNKKPTCADLKDSGDLEQDADVILLLYREEEDNNPPLSEDLEVIVGKNRNGDPGRFLLGFNPKFGRIINY